MFVVNCCIVIVCFLLQQISAIKWSFHCVHNYILLESGLTVFCNENLSPSIQKWQNYLAALKMPNRCRTLRFLNFVKETVLQSEL